MFSDTYMPNNSRQLVRHERLGWSRQRTARQLGGDELAHVPALMLRDGCETRNGAAIWSNDMGRVANDETLRMSRNGEIIAYDDLAVRCNIRVEGSCQRHPLYASAP